jgi:hypothetical protein
MASASDSENATPLDPGSELEIFMGLFEKLRSQSVTNLRQIADKHAPEIAEHVALRIGPLLGMASQAIDDDSKFLSCVATPLFRTLPPVVQLIGRERLKWDPIMFDMRDHLLVRADSSASVRPDAVPVALAILRKHFTGEQSDLLAAAETANQSDSSEPEPSIDSGRERS